MRDFGLSMFLLMFLLSHPLRSCTTCRQNQNPTQHLEEAEDIEVLKVPLDGLLGTLNAMAAEGCSVFAPLYSFAMASSLGL